MSTRFYFFTRYASIFIGAGTAFVQYFLYAKYLDQNNMALLVLLSGYSIFLVWIDAGLSKPVYPALRQAYCDGRPIGEELGKLIHIYGLLGLLAVVIFAIATWALGSTFENTLPMATLLVLGINLAINTATSFFRNIFNAIDWYISFEVTELIRRLGNIFTSLFIIVDQSMSLTAYSNLAVLLVVYLYVITALIRKSGLTPASILAISMADLWRYYRRFKDETKNYLVFMVNESLIYNWGYFAVPLFLDKKQIILYGLWSRVYGGMAIISRAIADISIHGITRHYFAANRDAAKTQKMHTLNTSMGLSATMIAAFVAFHDPIMKLWTQGKYQLDTSLLIALALWLFGNSIQHVAGTFLLAIGNHFRSVRNISSLMAIGIISSMTLNLLVTKNLGLTLTVTACIYLLGAMVYHALSTRPFGRLTQ